MARKEFKISELNELMRERDLKLISSFDTYKRQSDKFSFEDSQGYRYKISIAVLKKSIKRNTNLNKFFKGQIFTRHNMTTYINNNKLKISLIDTLDIWKGTAHTKLKLKCYKHGEFSFSWNCLSRGYNCPTCANISKGKHKRNSYKYVYEKFKENGFKLISKHYGNNEHPLDFECKKHGLQRASFGDLITQTFVCGECYNENLRTEFSKFKEDIEAKYKNITVDSNEDYISNESKIEITCLMCSSKRKVLVTCLKDNRDEMPCRECKKIETRKRLFNKSLNSNLESDKEVRESSVYKEWRNNIYKRDNYKCDLCDAHGRLAELRSHHLDGFNWALDKRFDLDNGITLCLNHHKQFHRLYGYGYNTKEQYKEFKSINDL